ncbi:MAG: biotin-dependent carboxyltransferase family protein [Desulfobacterales bacterium]
MDAFRILKPGPYTTVQDAGRYGFQQFGIPPTGVLDQFAYRAANMLLDNPENAAVLEATVIGPQLEVLSETDLAVTGAEAPITLNNQPRKGWGTFRARPGDILNIGPVKSGCRCYIGATGGLDVPLVMGSRSCYVAAGIGGHEGRLLAKGDLLQRTEGRLLPEMRQVPDQAIPTYAPEITLRAVPGPQDDFFDEGLELFYRSDFTVSINANRMGYRLEGPRIAQKDGMPKSIISEPSLPGGVQIPPDGQPIILLVEQTVGGYTKIATVISADLPRVAQAKPGDRIRFAKVDLAEAYAAARRQEDKLRKLVLGAGSASVDSKLKH